MKRSIPRQLSICRKVSIPDRQGTTPPIKSLLIAEASICRPAGRCLQLVRPIRGEGLSERGFTCGDLIPGKKFHYRHREVRSAAI